MRKYTLTNTASYNMTMCAVSHKKIAQSSWAFPGKPASRVYSSSKKDHYLQVSRAFLDKINIFFDSASL
jgi:hypothetical protein